MRPTEDRNQFCNYDGGGPPVVSYPAEAGQTTRCFLGDREVLNGIRKKSCWED